MLNNIVDNLEQCGQQNIVQRCFFIRPEQVVIFCCVGGSEHFELKVFTGYVPDSDHSMHLKCCASLWILPVTEHV